MFAMVARTVRMINMTNYEKPNQTMNKNDTLEDSAVKTVAILSTIIQHIIHCIKDY